MTVGHWYDGYDLTELGHGYGQNLLGRKSLSKLGGWPDLTQIRFNTIVLAQPLHRVMRVYASARKASCQLAYVLHWPIGLCDPMMLHQITTLLRMIHPSPTPQCACSPCNSPSGGKEEIQFEAKFSHIKFGNLQVAVEQTLTEGTVSTAQFCVGTQNNITNRPHLNVVIPLREKNIKSLKTYTNDIGVTVDLPCLFLTVSISFQWLRWMDYPPLFGCKSLQR